MNDQEHGHEPHAHPGPPPPPPDEELEPLRAMGATAEGTPPHHWQRGPADVRPLPSPVRVKLRGGGTAEATHEFRWFLDRVAGTDRRTAARRLYDVFLDPTGWVRAGVRWKRVKDRADADIVVRVIPQDETVCGPGSAGCYSWGYEADGKPVAEMGVEHIGREGPWLVIVGMEAQGHGTFRVHDHYVNHPGYQGVMGTWESAAAFGFSPSNAEIEGARRWLRGETPAELIHEH